MIDEVNIGHIHLKMYLDKGLAYPIQVLIKSIFFYRIFQKALFFKKN